MNWRRTPRSWRRRASTTWTPSPRRAHVCMYIYIYIYIYIYTHMSHRVVHRHTYLEPLAECLMRSPLCRKRPTRILPAGQQQTQQSNTITSRKRWNATNNHITWTIHSAKLPAGQRHRRPAADCPLRLEVEARADVHQGYDITYHKICFNSIYKLLVYFDSMTCYLMSDPCNAIFYHIIPYWTCIILYCIKALLARLTPGRPGHPRDEARVESTQQNNTHV